MKNSIEGNFFLSLPMNSPRKTRTLGQWGGLGKAVNWTEGEVYDNALPKPREILQRPVLKENSQRLMI